MAGVLIADDEEMQRDILKDILEMEKYNVFQAGNISNAMDLLRKEKIDIIISDYKMEDETGEELLEKVKFFYPDIAFVLITAYGTIETAVSCMQKGAYSFLTKPVNLKELKEVVKKALENRELKEENRRLKEIITSSSDKVNIVGEAKKVQEFKKIIDRVANLDVPVLIEGETGTGKELAAKSIHYNGNRNSEPFVAVNMAGIPENLIESELFGYEKGSFTGATKDKRGKFELAGSGTIFLDEIGEMDIDLQSKLLRVLQEEEIERIGSEKITKIKCRVVAATNRNLEEEIKNGNFREDLYYRLNLIKIKLPPLRERREDVPNLIKYFVVKYARKYGVDDKNISKYAEKINLKYGNYSFPGNIRELENLVERLLIFPDSSYEENISGVGIKGKNSYAGKKMDDIEKEAIVDTLDFCNGNKNRAAEMLGISERGIRYKLKDYGIE
jgi:DNA-binding NtrC family response regulator